MKIGLTPELLRRIFGNLGAVPGRNFGRAGLVMPPCQYDKQIAVEFGDGSTASYPVWVGQISNHFRAALTNLGTIDSPELIMVLLSGAEDAVTLGFKLDWIDNLGEFMQLTNKGWLPISTLHK